jgi:replication factor A1
MPAINVREQHNATAIRTSAVILNATPLERHSRGQSLTVFTTSALSFAFFIYSNHRSMCRFKLCVLAGDETGDADFILFGKQAQHLTRKSADTLIAENPIGFIPDELTRLLERTYNWNVSFMDSTTYSGIVTLQVNTVLGRVIEEGVVLPATPAGSQASSAILSPGPSTSVQSHVFDLSPLRAASEASQISTGTPARTALPVPAVLDSPQSVKKRVDEEVPFSFVLFSLVSLLLSWLFNHQILLLHMAKMVLPRKVALGKGYNLLHFSFCLAHSHIN